MTPLALPKPRGISFIEAIKASLDPEGFFASQVPAEGDLFCVTLPGAGPLYLSGHPDGAKEIFRAPAATFEPPLPNPIEPLLGPGSLILLSGRPHKRERKLLAPPFHGARMRAYGGLMQTLAEDALDRLEPGAIVDARELTRDLTLLVIIRALFGVRDPERVHAVRDAIEATTQRYSGILALLPFTRFSFMGLSPWDRFQSAKAKLDAVLSEEIERRRQSGQRGEDILSLLLDLRYEDGECMSDAQLLDELRTLLVAGHETAATGLAWALGYVHQSQRVRKRLLGDLERDDPAGSPYLDAICKESLRRHPVVPVVLRRLRRPFTFRGARIPAGANIGLALTRLHTRPEVWEHPKRFYPEHFVDKSYTPFEYAPYGGGARRCAGAAFAGFEMRTLLGTLLARGCFESAGDLPQPVTHSITMSPGGPIPLRFLGRY